MCLSDSPIINYFKAGYYMFKFEITEEKISSFLTTKKVEGIF